VRFSLYTMLMSFRSSSQRCEVCNTSRDRTGGANAVEGEQFANAFFTLETKIKIAKMYVAASLRLSCFSRFRPPSWPRRVEHAKLTPQA